jgi:Zn-finger nucleic acid-binding protein
MDQQKPMNCPRCSGVLGKRKMRKLSHPSGAVLDVCDKCGGMWLDGPEVKLLYGFSGKKPAKKK